MITFYFPQKKLIFDEYPVAVDFSEWLGDETISSASYSAWRTDTDEDASAVVLDSGKHTKTDKIVRPWIKGGVDKGVYEVSVQVTTNTGAKGEARIRFEVVA